MSTSESSSLPRNENKWIRKPNFGVEDLKVFCGQTFAFLLSAMYRGVSQCLGSRNRVESNGINIVLYLDHNLNSV